MIQYHSWPALKRPNKGRNNQGVDGDGGAADETEHGHTHRHR